MSAEARPPPLPPATDGSTLFDLLPLGAYRSLPDGRILRANPALVRLNGYADEAELLGAVQDIAREWYVDPARRAEFRHRLEHDGRVRDFVSEVRRHRNGEHIWVAENAHAVRDAAGSVLFYEGTVEEVTDRVYTQQALERSEAQLRLISAQLPGIVYLAHVDREGLIRFLFISDGVRRLYGVEPEEAMRDGHVLQRMRHPDDDARVQEGLVRSEHEAGTHMAEFRIVRRDGTVRWVQATSTPIHRELGGDHRCGLIIDVTNRHEAEALRTQRDRAEAARRAIADLLARISHELRTPLNAVLGFAQLLQGDETLGDRQRHFAAESLRAGRHLLALVDDLLDLGRAESGEVTLVLETLNPAGPLRESAALLGQAADEADVTLRLPTLPLPMVHADAQRLRQVLTNLLSNAVKYNRAGGWVQVDAERQGAQVAISVCDSGAGLSPEQIDRLFQPFERLGAERSQIAGTGLGLTLSRQLARAMGGDITVQSTPGQGTCFTLTLPAAAA